MPVYDQDGEPTSNVLADGPRPSPGQLPGTEQSPLHQLQAVDAALADLAALPVDAQVAAYTELHQQLTAALAVTATAAGSPDDPPQQSPGQPPHRSR